VLGAAGAVPEQLEADLVLMGYRPVVGDGTEALPHDTSVALVVVRDANGFAVERSEELRRAAATRATPIVWLVEPEGLHQVLAREHLVDEFVTLPYAANELAARLLLLRRRGDPGDADTMRRGPLELNRLSYQVALDRRPLDLTYMEYELLKLLMTHPGRVFTREEILATVWGYDYFGGMRSVDVHVRRLRAKLGQDHAWLIETVRSVGYRLAEVRS
jgi:DNA-binding response OmpR family regulator